MNSQAISYPKGRYNPGGISKVWYAYPEDIATFPTLADPETATTYTSLVEYATAITMKTGKQFFELYCTLEEGEVQCKQVGQRDGKGYRNSVGVSFPGNTSLIHGFRAAGANRDFILIVKEKNGVLRVIGDLDNTATIDTDEEGSGKKVEDKRENKLTFGASGATPAPIYTEDITELLTPAA